jgi:hypothetical protein
MSFDEDDTAGTPGFPLWVRAVALLLIVSLVGWFVLTALL